MFCDFSREQELGDDIGPFPLMEELTVLRQKKSELEMQLTTLQDSRKQLMVQLESLMKMIKVFSRLYRRLKSLL